MLTPEEKKFIEYWEVNRHQQKKLWYILTFGLPVGVVFAFPILLSVIFSGWYKNMTFISGSQVTVILIAVLGIAVFFALFRMKFKWEENEQLYKELKIKNETSNAAKS